MLMMLYRNLLPSSPRSARRATGTALATLLAILLIFLPVLPVRPAQAQEPSETPLPELWFTNGSVEAMVRVDNTLYLGGGFTYVGPFTGSGVPLDANSGEALLTFPQVNGTIDAVAPDGAGGWYIGGYFTEVGDLPRNNIAHILPDFTVDPVWNPDANGEVFTLAVNGATVLSLHGIEPGRLWRSWW
jgi:hypothetical protein